MQLCNKTYIYVLTDSAFSSIFIHTPLVLLPSKLEVLMHIINQKIGWHAYMYCDVGGCIAFYKIKKRREAVQVSRITAAYAS